MMTPLIALTWPQMSVAVVLFLAGCALGAEAIRRFMRGAHVDGERRRLEREQQHRDAGKAALRRSREMWAQQRSAAGERFHPPEPRRVYEGEHPPVGRPPAA